MTTEVDDLAALIAGDAQRPGWLDAALQRAVALLAQLLVPQHTVPSDCSVIQHDSKPPRITYVCD
jgi:hypothetical protein